MNADRPVTFAMLREEDTSGVSGTGHVLDGCLFADGTTVVRWRSGDVGAQSTTVYGSFGDFLAIHVDSHPENRAVVRFDHDALPEYRAPVPPSE